MSRIKRVLAHFPVFGFAVMLACGCTGLRAEERAPPTENEALSLLVANNFADLDKIYTAIQNEYRRGLISENDLRADFRVFYLTDDALAPQYEAWVRHSPGSYAAHLARGIYYKKIGQENLSGNEILNVGDFQTAKMDPALQIADQELRKSLLLDSKPVLTYLHLLNVRTFLGDQAGARVLYDRAIALDPRSFIIRENYLGALKTRWGGGVDQMRAFLTECQHAELPPRQLSALEAAVVEDEAWVHRYLELDTDAALRDYERAAVLSPETSCLPCGPIIKAADLLRDSKRYDEAIIQYTKVLTFDAKSIYAHNGRAFAELELGLADAAFADFSFAANLGDAYAQDMLGRMYLIGTSVPQNRNKAIMWLEKAAQQGYAPAIELLPLAMNKNAKPMLMPGSRL